MTAATDRVAAWRERRQADPRHDKRTASWLGVALGVSFTVCFVTGLASHLLQHRPSWFAWPTRPVWLFRLTQGLHVFTGIVSVPLLLAKLWSVAHRLLDPPKVRPISGLVARVSLIPLVAGSLFLLVTGVLNIDYWYPFRFYFPPAHYAVAWLTVGALVVHIGARDNGATGARPGWWGGSRAAPGRRPGTAALPRIRGGIVGHAARRDRGRDDWAAEATRAAGTTATRRRPPGPAGQPVLCRVADSPRSVDPARWRLRVHGQVARPVELTLSQLEALPQRSAALPIACVEGWSAERTWTGVSVHDVLALAGVTGRPSAVVRSLDRGSTYAPSELTADQVADSLTLLALRVDGEVLHPDHGYPLRLIAPARPGVLQTKWLAEIEVR